MISADFESDVNFNCEMAIPCVDSVVSQRSSLSRSANPVLPTPLLPTSTTLALVYLASLGAEAAASSTRERDHRRITQFVAPERASRPSVLRATPHTLEV